MWLVNFLFKSSIGQKLVMSLTGLFLISFLVIHLIGNLQLLFNDGGEAFNTYAYFMTHNPLIKTISYGLYFFILLHAFQGIVIYFRNKSSGGGGSRYAVTPKGTTSDGSKHMALLGTLVLFFLLIHMGDFWLWMKLEWLDKVPYAGYEEGINDLYAKVSSSFSNPLIVVAYLIGLVALAIHLLHGFQSAFQTLGLNHKKYTPAIQAVGKLIAFALPIGFAIIPIVMFCRAKGLF